MLRKRFMKTVKVGKGGSRGGRGADAGGGGGGRGLQLSRQQQDLLVSLFERYNASRLNADLVIAGMRRGPGGGDGDELGPGGVEMSSGQLTTWLKKLGLRFKQLTDNQVGGTWRAGTLCAFWWAGWGCERFTPPGMLFYLAGRCLHPSAGVHYKRYYTRNTTGHTTSQKFYRSPVPAQCPRMPPSMGAQGCTCCTHSTPHPTQAAYP